MPDDNRFRRAVQDGVEELLSKRHDTSTSRLIMEAMIEGMKLYQSYEEQEKQEERERRESDEKRRCKRHKKASCGDEDGHRRHHDHTHCKRSDGSKDGRRYQGCGRSHNRDHRRHSHNSYNRHSSNIQGKDNDGSLRVYHDRSRSRPRDGHSNYHPTAKIDNTHGLTTEEGHLMSGANGHLTSREDLISESRPHSVPDQLDVSNSRRTAPTSDCLITKESKVQPREQLRFQKYRSRPGLITKKDPKARSAHLRGEEDDAPSHYQSRAHQRHSDTWAGGTSTYHLPMQQQRDPDSTLSGGLPKSKAGMTVGFCDHFVSTYKQIKAEQDAGYRSRGLIEKLLVGAKEKRSHVKTSTDKQDCNGRVSGQFPREGQRGDNVNEEDGPIHAQPHASRSFEQDDTSNLVVEKPHSPAEPEMTSEISSPIMPYAPSPPRLVGRDADNARAGLLDSIQGGVRLRRVASLDKRDKSASSSAGRVLYEATEHSREVEERERAQGAQAEGETDTGPEPSRGFREDLVNALEGRKARLSRS